MSGRRRSQGGGRRLHDGGGHDGIAEHDGLRACRRRAGRAAICLGGQVGQRQGRRGAAPACRQASSGSSSRPRQAMQKRFARGNFQATLTVAHVAAAGQPVVNEAFLKDLAGLARRLREQFGAAAGQRRRPAGAARRAGAARNLETEEAAGGARRRDPVACSTQRWPGWSRHARPRAPRWACCSPAISTASRR